jgi:heat shock protein HslJ
MSAGSSASPGLDGSAWVLSELPGMALVPQSASTLQFAAGRASGSAGCNRYTASYESGRDTLKFGTAAATRMMCATAGVMEQEQAFLSALGMVATFRMEGDRLELRSADGALAASFRPVTGSR